MKMTGRLLLFTTLLTSAAQAAFVEDRIHDVERGSGEEESLVELEQGRVLWVRGAQKDLIVTLEKLAGTRELVRLDVEETTNTIRALSLLETPAEKTTTVELAGPAGEPTVFATWSEALAAFRTMDSRTKADSQCYNRAHGWAYDLWRTQNVETQKLFLFFTRKYIRAYRYKWWFHNTPMTLVAQGPGAPVEYTLDRRFTRSPLKVKTWTNIFMRNDAQCASVEFYSEYRQNQNAQWCYLMRSSQYYRTPSDLMLLERNGRQETKWVPAEIRRARKQAFIYWRNYDPKFL